jgi:hypothetical protein
MYSWNTMALVQAICGTPPREKAPQKEKDEYSVKAQAVANFLSRVYEELRNLGITPQDRASAIQPLTPLGYGGFKDAIRRK